MSPARWQEVESAFDAVLDADPAQRPAVLDRVCADDDELRREVCALLSAHDSAGSYLEAGAREYAGSLLSDDATEPPLQTQTRRVPLPRTDVARPASTRIKRADPAVQDPAPARRSSRWAALLLVALATAGVLIWFIIPRQSALSQPRTSTTVLVRSATSTLSASGTSTLTAGELLAEGEQRVAEQPADATARASLQDVLGRIALELGHYDEAARWADAAVKSWNRLPPEDRPESVATTDLVAQVYLARGDADAAENAARQALTLRHDLLPSDHPDIAAGMNQLGTVLASRGSPEATEILQTALERRRAHYGSDHVHVANTLNNLGVVAHRQRDLVRAEQHYRAALEIYDDARSGGRPHALTIRGNLAALLHDREYVDEARALYEQVVERTRTLYGDAHPKLALSLYNYAALLHEQNQIADADSLYRETLSILETLPALHPQRATATLSYGRLLVQDGRYDDAEEVLRAATDLWMNERGASDAQTRAFASTLIDLYDRWDRPNSAARYRTRLENDS